MKKKMHLVVRRGGAEVDLSYTDPHTDEKITRHFHVATQGRGYVREGDHQACDGLYSTGSTLMSTPAGLPAVIRREYRRMIRMESHT